MRIFRRNTERPDTTPEVQWTNPFGEIAIDTEKVLDSLNITMQSGELKTSAIKTAEALNPIVARKVAFDALAHWLVDGRKSSCDELEQAQTFIDSLVPPKVISQAEEATEAHSQKLRFSLHLLEANHDDYDQAIKAGVEIISQSVEHGYKDACTPEKQAELSQDFEAWKASN